MQKILRYLNPIVRLGDKKYSFLFPFLTTFFACVLLETYAYQIAHDPEAVGFYAIFVFIGLIIYFAFRDGLLGGFIATAITIGYYFYIISSRNYTGQQRETSIEATVILAFLYVFLAGTIGWLKQTIDTLIEREADEKRRLQTIMQQLPVGVVVTDHTGKVLQTNKQLDTLIGIKVPVGYQIGNDPPLIKSYTNGRTSSSHSPLMQALTSGKSVVGREMFIEKSGGKKIFVRVNAAVIRNRHGKIIAAASIVDDVTSLREIEKRKDDFVNIASHELKTPVTSIKLFIDVLLRRKNDAESHKMLVTVKSQVQRLQDLVNDLLDVSRLQTGKLSLSREKFRIDTMMAETLEELQQTMQDTKINFDKKAAVSVYGDKFRIMQVVTNLITNAVKYSPVGSTVDVELKRNKEYVLVSVRDLGIGVPVDYQKKIFTRLYQVPGTYDRSFRGLGMGLYICREIIRKHHGKIWVESEKGKGSTFYFTLPIS